MLIQIYSDNDPLKPNDNCDKHVVYFYFLNVCDHGTPDSGNQFSMATEMLHNNVNGRYVNTFYRVFLTSKVKISVDLTDPLLNMYE